MAQMTNPTLETMEQLLAPYLGLPLADVFVGEHGSLTLGFGSIAKVLPRVQRPYRLMECRTYCHDWTILQNDTKLTDKASNGVFRGQILDLAALGAGEFSGVQIVNACQAEITTSNNWKFSFIQRADIDFQDEAILELFLPGNTAASFYPNIGWNIASTVLP